MTCTLKRIGHITTCVHFFSVYKHTTDVPERFYTCSVICSNREQLFNIFFILGCKLPILKG